MDIMPVAVLAVVIVGFLFARRLSLISAAKAQEYLRHDAKVIDVRTAEEYRQGHIQGALNVPLDSIAKEIGKHAPSKDQPLLLHCAGGVRSGMAGRALKQLGYTHAFNLGSYARAERIVRGVR